MSRRIITCRCCGKTRKHLAHGYCSSCYTRWDRAGRPAVCPPPARHRFTAEDYAASARARAADRRYRIDEYAFLLSCGETRERAAEQLGICLRTARDYEKALADRRENYQEAA